MVAKGRTTYRPRRHRWSSQTSTDESIESISRKNKWNFAFCFIFTNQAGTVIFSFAGFALMITTMLVHWYAPSLTSTGVRALQNLLIHVYLIVMITGFILAFVAAYVEKGVLAKVAALLVLIGTVLYLIFYILSFFTESMVMLYVCPEMRCPDHHWFQDSTWRGYVLYTENIERYKNIEEEIKKIEEKINSAMHKELVSKEFNNSYGYVLLEDLFPKIYPEKKNPDISLKSEAENATTAATEKDDDDLESPKEEKGHYIRVLSPDNEGNTILVVISVLFGLMILAFFIYAIITFYAFGVYLSRSK